MKKLKYLIALVALLIAQLLSGCTGYIVATGPPPPPDEVIIVAPSPRYVWVPGYYEYRGGTYVWIKGSYRIPPVENQVMYRGNGIKHLKGISEAVGIGNNFNEPHTTIQVTLSLRYNL
jgi:hypothetical protein